MLDLLVGVLVIGRTVYLLVVLMVNVDVGLASWCAG